MTEAQKLFVPPRPDPPENEPDWRQLYKLIRSNALQTWPKAAFTEDYFAGSMFGRQRLLLNSPEAIRRVLVDNTAHYGRYDAVSRLLDSMLGEGLVLSHGSEWRRQRHAISPALTPRAMPMLASQVAAITDDAIARLAGPASGTPVDLMAEIQLVGLEVAARSIFSIDVRPYVDRLRQLLESFGAQFSRLDVFDLMLPAFPSLRDLRRKKWRTKWIALIDEIIAARSQSSERDTPRDLFEILRAARDLQTGAAFSHEQIRDQLGTLLVTGHAPTAITISWCLYLLAAAPAEQERVFEEVRDISLEPESAAAAVAQLSRTQAVVNETMRLYPPASQIARKALRRDRIGDVNIARGALVIVAPWVLHRHRRLWQNPDAFDPSRFLNVAPPRFTFLPFGAGPRVCVGAYLALTEAALVIAKLVKRFQIELADQTPVHPVAVLLTVPNRTPLFRLRERL
jgi:cytochrome P450